MKKIRVLVVDDSLTFRQLLVNGINKDPALEVVAVAADAYEARDEIIRTRPDVMTLDVELPKMSGIEFLRRLLPQYVIPVIMVSALNEKVFDAMAAGAVDFVNKPQAMRPEDIANFVENELNTKIKIASTAKVSLPVGAGTAHVRHTTGSYGDRVVAIGASTGGTEAIFDVVKQFDKDIPGTVIVQHMPPGFTKMYADRLNRDCKVEVREAKNGDRVETGLVLVAPGDKQMRLVRVGDHFEVTCMEGEKVSGHCPSVDVLFDSVAQTAGNKAIGVILTGMGADGSNGLLAMRNAGAHTIGQDEATCVVYGMPKVAFEKGGVEVQAPLDSIAGKVYKFLNQ